jgi:hypothetical protein
MTRRLTVVRYAFKSGQRPNGNYLACAAEPALRRFERYGFGQVPSDGVHFVPVLSDVVGGLWFFCAALVGPIANLNASPFPESNADAS